MQEQINGGVFGDCWQDVFQIFFAVAKNVAISLRMFLASPLIEYFYYFPLI